MNRLQQSRRQKIGTTYTPQINNNVASVPYMRNTYNIQNLAFEQDQMNMSGAGVKDVLLDAFDKGRKTASFLFKHREAIKNAYTGELGTKLRNMIPSSDENAADGFPGEKHSILKLPNGKYGLGNYIGPGTALVARLKRGDKPRTEVDKVAQGHDIRYLQAKNVDDIRKADNIMLNKIDAIARNRGDAPQNIAAARLIKAKVLGENLGVIKRDAFMGNPVENARIADENKDLINGKLKQLEMEGYGLLPGDVLKMKILKGMVKDRSLKERRLQKTKAKKVKMSGKGVSMDKTLPGMKGYKINQGTLSGAGLNLPGKGAIGDFVVNQIIPSIMKSVGIPLDTIQIGTIKKVVSKALEIAKSGNLPSIIANLSKAILPILTAGKIKSIGGSGLGLAGRGIGEFLGKHKDMLLSHLSKGLLKAFRYFMDKKGSGLGLAGGSFANFWKGFKKGFKMVFKPIGSILGPVATALGVPEIGIPVSAIAEAL